ncbi:bifunctional lysylphosphatidylglycerol synthetase/lysine--tRNA ligase LysX [Nocardioides sp. zg-579]|uniref:Lysine--tRNA ligase n=1 Tax=Nocardioides marmotae TaxID=2663857 RepID=A0A6I3J5B2_9ACTN|nr:bifunctional lysylphosphatidylglycerol synthetase/lysine--tRNA ligase LysX [Nocardioides marmotae]MCR6030750.1 bifunctional lysylphosphatidylglycerol synthetase/lysine--tRNA ligase LysX [Gordonia jinghuaiqii]MTB94384.1 bifunctional lysylphosphatidylglycerol synthetase/lysine--tRNA ligase LysX [Nocardioides marmotae]QKE01590.1 bifunctional lysylphosphatidylglycerol synthetase/lysine--tRNA ligase LysX [Nocardioides marmotae]
MTDQTTDPPSEHPTSYPTQQPHHERHERHGTLADRRPRLHLPADDRWPDRFAGVLFGFAGLVVVVALVPPWHRYFSRETDPVSLLTIPVVPSLVYAALLLVTAVALRRRLRAAWWVVMVWWLGASELGRVVMLGAGEHVVLAAIGLVVVGLAMVLAVRVRDQFVARRAPGDLATALAVFLGGGLATVAGGAALVSGFGRSPDYPTSLSYVLHMILLDLGRIGPETAASAPWWVRLVIGLVGAVVVLGAATVLFRAPRDTRTLGVADEARVRALLRDFGDHDSLGYFATRRDKAVVWDTGAPETARAGVSYRVVGSVSLASGNPVGDPDWWPAAIERWRDRARANGWSLAVMGAGHEGALAYADAGLSLIDLGDEAIVDLGGFSLHGPGMRSVRQSVSRLRRRGYTTRVVRHASLTEADFATLDAAAASWRGDGGDERGFSMALGRLADPLDRACVLVAAHDADGELRGFLSFVPWGRTGLSLDLMRRDPTADNGLVELMVASLADHAAAFGVGPVSLNFAMFREAFERGAELGALPVARLWRQGLVLASRTWQLESLYRSNAKYLPEWRPRYLAYEYASDLPRVGMAAGSAEGFLTAPSIGRLRRHGHEDGLRTSGADRAEAVLALVPPPPDLVAEAVSPDHLPEQVRVRRAKLDAIRAAGIDPYPVSAPRTHTLAEVRGLVPDDLAPDTETGTRVSVVGRVLLKRDMGRLGFATLRDGSGDLQVMVDAAHVAPADLDFWEHRVDLGDHVGVTGTVITTRAGELTVRAEAVVLTSKALRPLPDKHEGLTDPDARVRMRYVDLIVRPEARTTAYQRAAVVRSVRDSLHARGFTEVETPVLQTVHGGANARPFETHINAYDLDLYLRIATELHLKRLVVGGMERVFEIGRQFRNEGADFKHNPEFTSLEVYRTYGDYDSMRVLTQEIVQEAATAVYGAPVARRHDADGRLVEHDLSGEWPVRTVCQAVSEALGEEVTTETPLSTLVRHADRIGIELELDPSWGVVLEEIYSELCEGRTTTPVFYTDFPKENAPLTRPHRHDPRLTEKWDLVMFGAEQGTAYSELIDPVDQRERLVAQSLLAAAGDPEAMQVDEDFLRALEHGMPPTGGMGLGIDRLVMNLTGLSIRDTILFPLVKPQG